MHHSVYCLWTTMISLFRYESFESSFLKEHPSVLLFALLSNMHTGTKYEYFISRNMMGQKLYYIMIALSLWNVPSEDENDIIVFCSKHSTCFLQRISSSVPLHIYVWNIVARDVKQPNSLTLTANYENATGVTCFCTKDCLFGIFQ